MLKIIVLFKIFIINKICDIKNNNKFIIKFAKLKTRKLF